MLMAEFYAQIAVARYVTRWNKQKKNIKPFVVRSVFSVFLNRILAAHSQNNLFQRK